MNPVCPVQLWGGDSIQQALASFIFQAHELQSPSIPEFKIVQRKLHMPKSKSHQFQMRQIQMSEGLAREPQPPSMGRRENRSTWKNIHLVLTIPRVMGWRLWQVFYLPSKQLAGSILSKVTEHRSVWWNRYNMNNIWQDNDTLCVTWCCPLKLSIHICPRLLGNHNSVLITEPRAAESLCFTHPLI